MTCPQGHAATTYTIPHPMTAVPMDLVRCLTCKRELQNGVWLRMGGFCDGCDLPTWRMIPHPVSGHDILLWPKGSTRFALILTPGGLGEKAYRDYCPACCPDFGEAAKRDVEVGGQPIPTGACVGWETPHARYADRFSDRQGTFLGAWLRDHLGMSDEAITYWIDTWITDRDYRAEAISAALTETPHG
jgi:hypothetical protein